MKVTAGVFVYAKDIKKFLILHPSGDYNKFAKWSIPKGEADKELILSTVAQRELKEETSIEVDQTLLIPLGYEIYKSKQKTLFGYLYATDRKPFVQLDWENDKYKWTTYSEAMKLVHEAQKKMLRKANEFIKLHYNKKGK